MYQSDRGSYRTNDSLISMFLGTCLGKIVLALGILLALTIVAWITCPSDAHMRERINDDLVQCIQRNDSVRLDPVDEIVANVAFFFTKADSSLDRSVEMAFRKYNRTEIYNHGIYTTMFLFNNANAEGSRCALGVFGMVFPLLSYGDILLSVEPMRREYKPKPVELETPAGDTLDFGEIPNLIFEEEEYY